MANTCATIATATSQSSAGALKTAGITVYQHWMAAMNLAVARAPVLARPVAPALHVGLATMRDGRHLRHAGSVYQAQAMHAGLK